MVDVPRVELPADTYPPAAIAAVPAGMSMQLSVMLVGGVDDPALLAATSPVNYVTPDAPAFLLVHGDRDGAVPYEQTELLSAALAQAGVIHDVVTVNGGDHCFFGPEDQLDSILANAVDFFSRTLART